MITATRKLEFDYGRRVLRHESKCKHLHGHRGVIEVTVSAPDLDSIGRVIDFGQIKSILGKWVDDNWDHQVLLHADDPQLLHLTNTEPKPPYVMKSGNPTAENMAREFFEVAKTLLQPPLKIESVRMWETPNCYAEYSE